MLRCTFDRKITAVNPAWTEILGWPENELVGCSLFDFVHRDDLQRTAQGAMDLAAGRGHERFDNRYRHRDGSYRWISWATRSNEGVITATGRDVTREIEQAHQLGQGTTVCIYLPRHQGPIADDATSSEVALQPRSYQGETVLVVDDESTIRMLLADTLAELGYSSLEAADSASGLKILESDVRVDLLITDVGLPGGMNGRQMADAARVRRPDLKVLFITGYAENAVLRTGHLETGMSVMTKPFPIEAMAARIRALIEE